MAISKNDKKEIEVLVLSNGFTSRQVNTYSRENNKNWAYSSVNRIVRQIKERGTAERKKGSGRIALAQKSPEIVGEILKRFYPLGPSDKGNKQKIANELGIDRSTVRKIIQKEDQKSDERGFLFE